MMANNEITIFRKYTMSAWQSAVKAHPAKMELVRAGRQSGKSTLGLDWIIDGALRPNTINGIVTPTGRQGKDIFWNELMETFEPHGAIKSKNAQLCDLVLNNNSRISVRGTNMEDNLRGFKWHRLLLDEFAYHKRGVWEKVLRQQLLAYNGDALFISSPKGHNHFRKMEEYIRQQAAKFPGDYAFWHKTIYDNPFLGMDQINRKLLTKAQLKAHIDKEKSSNSEEEWRQEYLAEYIDWVGTVYHECEFDKHIFNPQERFQNYKTSPYVKCLDWGLNDDTACIWEHIFDNKLLIADEYVKNNSDPTSHYRTISAMDEGRNPNAQHNVIDKTAFKRESSGKSVAQQFSELGLRPLCPSSGDIDYGINIVKRLFNSGQLLISTRCQRIIKSVDTWEYGKHEPDELAAMRYGAVYAVERGLITIEDGKGITGNPTPNPISPGQIQRIRVHRDEGWNFEDGCLD